MTKICIHESTMIKDVITKYKIKALFKLILIFLMKRRQIARYLCYSWENVFIFKTIN